MCLLSLCITCQGLCTYSEKVLSAVPCLCLFWREARCVRWAVFWRQKPLPWTRRDPRALPPPPPLPNFRLVLPVQHMTLSLCCLTKHWPRLPTHSHAGWTNDIKEVHKRKVALGVKTGKSCSRRDTVCQQCCSFYHTEIRQRSNCDGWRGWGRSCEDRRQTLSDKVSVAVSFFGVWPLP